MTLETLETPALSSPPTRVLAARIAQAVRAGFSRYGLLLGFLILWQLGSTQGWLNATVFPPLDMIFAALWDGLTSGALIDDIAISLQRSGLAFAAAVGLGRGRVGRRAGRVAAATPSRMRSRSPGWMPA